MSFVSIFWKAIQSIQNAIEYDASMSERDEKNKPNSPRGSSVLR